MDVRFFVNGHSATEARSAAGLLLVMGGFGSFQKPLKDLL